MKNNTVVMACDQNYFWGAYLLIASMRRNGMDNPALVLESGFTPEMKHNLLAFGDVRLEPAPMSKRNMTCRKPEAMLMADTDFITWADCDGFFVGNCSDKLSFTDPDMIHVRLRSEYDNGDIYKRAGLYEPGELFGVIPHKVLETWKRDVGGRTEPAHATCASACYVSVHKSHRPFLERWRDQMIKVLPDRDKGVFDPAGGAYFQTDESVLNSLLCFLEDAPKTGEFMLNKSRKSIYYHVVMTPKPWQWWSPYSMRYYDDVMELMRWCLSQGLVEIALPWTLDPPKRLFHKLGTPWSYAIRTRVKLRRMMK
ncbi:MAG: hypothetical protein PHI35_09445 [Victivallaceae bacterium]|nr:hypothetical protein [Victivallaceae bacterium]